MDATRPRRTRDAARQGWYARWRSARFARRLGFPPTTAAAPGPHARPCELLGDLPACWAWGWGGLAFGVPALAGEWLLPAARWGWALASLWASLAWGQRGDHAAGSGAAERSWERPR
jgi:hypothetical protein